MSCWTDRNKFKLSFILMLILTFLLIITKVVIGYKENSLSLVADSFHLIVDIPALVIGYLALQFAGQDGVDGKFTFGRIRAEILGAMVNAVFLIAICFSLGIESIKHLAIPHEIENPRPVLIVGIISLVIDVIGLTLFRCRIGCAVTSTNKHPDATDPGDQDLKLNLNMDLDSDSQCRSGFSENKKSNPRRSKVVTPPTLLNIHGVFLHILQHAFTSSIVVTSALVYMNASGGWKLYVDPCLSLILVAFILTTIFPLLQECLATLMQSVPADLQLQNMEKRLMKYVPEVVDVHELHIWQLAGNEIVGSAHIVFRSYKMYNQDAVNAVQEFLNREGISSLTMQPEFADFANDNNENEPDELFTSNDKCMLKCAEKNCEYLKCCATPKELLVTLQHQH
eukprot:gene6012-6710_t